MMPIVPEVDKNGYKIFEHAYQFYFCDKIYYSKVEEQITKELLKLSSQSDHIYNDHLAGDIKSQYLLYHDLNKKNYIGSEFIDKIYDMLRPHISNIIKEECKVFRLADLWINYQKATEFNPAHEHTGTFSFVWYLDIPEQIRDEYKDSIGNGPSRGLIRFQAEHTNDSLKFNPQTNDLFIFRSTHIHEVYPFYSDNTRISVSGNIVL